MCHVEWENMNRYPAIALKRKKKSFDDDEGIDDGIAVRANLLYCEKRRLSIEKKEKNLYPPFWLSSLPWLENKQQ